MLCPARELCGGRPLRPFRDDHPQRDLRRRPHCVSQFGVQLLAGQPRPLQQYYEQFLYQHGRCLLVLLHRRGAVYLLGRDLWLMASSSHIVTGQIMI